MKAGLLVGMIATVLMASSMAVHAQHGGPPELNRGGVPDGGWGVPQQEMAPHFGPGAMKAGGPPRERMDGCAIMRGCPPGIPDPDSMRKAGASEQQIVALEEFMFEQRMKLIDLRAASEKAEMTMERLLRASNTDEKALMQAVDALNQARGALFKTDVESRMKVKQVLGEELLRKLREQGPPNRPERRGEGGGVDRPEAPPRDAGPRPAPERQR
jgi:hypothetical protein